MACEISFKDQEIQYNNMQFSSTIDFVIETAEKMSSTEDEPMIVRMKRLNNEEFWPGRGIEIETDFPELAERKFWARIFYETARDIFERKIGIHDYNFWQSQRIYQIYGTAGLFEIAVREIEPSWSPDIRDYREFDRVRL